MKTLQIPLRDDTNYDVNVFTVDEYIAAPHEFKFDIIQRRRIYNQPLAFDIETSHIDEDDERFTFMYVWQMCIDGDVVIGRHWNEWPRLLSWLHEALRVTDRTPVCIYVHNLAYEFAFIKKRLPIIPESVFAKEKNHPIAFTLGDELEGFRFRCSYSLSNKSLAGVAAGLHSIPFQKLDLDYDEVRTPSTPLTDKEIAYDVADVLIVWAYVCEHLDNYRFVKNIPMTATGKVRKSGLARFGHMPSWQKFFKQMRLDEYQYRLYRAAFAGGDTHMNAQYRDEVVRVKAYDLASSYPSRYVEVFPASPPITVSAPSIAIYNDLREHGFMFIATLICKDFHLKTLHSFDVLSRSRCRDSESVKSENGRILSADWVAVTLTSIDIDVINAEYDYELVDVVDIVYHKRKALLPKPFRDFVFSFYRTKTTLKGVEGKECEYMVDGKIPLNSIYGMTVTDVTRPDIDYVPGALDEWRVCDNSVSDKLAEFYANRNSYLPYFIGVWTTAYARADLHRALYEIGDDAVYWDTDSIKFIGNHDDVFERINAEKLEKLAEFDPADVSPLDIHGEPHPIGLWEKEYHGESVLFKSFGAKKYFIKTNSGKEHITVAGLNGNKTLGYLHNHGIDLFSISFDSNKRVEIPPEWSGRTCSEIINEPHTAVINGEVITELSYLNIYNVSYTFSDTAEHVVYCAWKNGELLSERRRRNELQR